MFGAIALVGLVVAISVRASDRGWTEGAPTERVRTTSDFSEGEIIAVADTARRRLDADEEADRSMRAGVDRSTARARARARVEAMEEAYWHALENVKPSAKESARAIFERLPKRDPRDRVAAVE